MSGVLCTAKTHFPRPRARFTLNACASARGRCLAQLRDLARAPCGRDFVALLRRWCGREQTAVIGTSREYFGKPYVSTHNQMPLGAVSRASGALRAPVAAAGPAQA